MVMKIMRRGCAPRAPTGSRSFTDAILSAAILFKNNPVDVVGALKVAALEYASLGIRLNALCPDFIETPMVMERGVEADTHPEVYEQIGELHPMGRLDKSEEIAEAAI
jgi:Enoyl-(Acyl carrier protein) reductase